MDHLYLLTDVSKGYLPLRTLLNSAAALESVKITYSRLEHIRYTTHAINDDDTLVQVWESSQIVATYRITRVEHYDRADHL